MSGYDKFLIEENLKSLGWKNIAEEGEESKMVPPESLWENQDNKHMQQSANRRACCMCGVITRENEMAIKRNYECDESYLTCDECGMNLFTESGGIVECDEKLLKLNDGKEEAYCYRHGENGKKLYDTWRTSPAR